MDLIEGLARLAWPAPCLACGAVEPPLARALGLCPACADLLRSVEGARCPTCARPFAAARASPLPCLACRRRRLPHRGLVVGRVFVEPMVSVVHAYKFGRLAFLGRQLARDLAPKIAATDLDVVVPVPLHWRRHLARGYNQAEEIARPLAGRLGLPMHRLLRRVRATSAQARLPRRERAGNLRGAFRPRSATRRFRSVLLVDDVLTTGATLLAAARVLRRAGIERVTLCAAARTPDAGEPGATPAPRARMEE